MKKHLLFEKNPGNGKDVLKGSNPLNFTSYSQKMIYQGKRTGLTEMFLLARNKFLG